MEIFKDSRDIPYDVNLIVHVKLIILRLSLKANDNHIVVGFTN